MVEPMKKCYLAGPMSAIPDLNFPAFFKAASDLKSLGFQVFNPAAQDIQDYGADVSSDPTQTRSYAVANIGKPSRYKECLKKDLEYILDEAEVIALLPGWENSPGARTELALAECLGLEVIHLV
jgi:hypothetical protein